MWYQSCPLGQRCFGCVGICRSISPFDVITSMQNSPSSSKAWQTKPSLIFIPSISASLWGINGSSSMAPISLSLSFKCRASPWRVSLETPQTYHSETVWYGQGIVITWICVAEYVALLMIGCVVPLAYWLQILVVFHTITLNVMILADPNKTSDMSLCCVWDPWREFPM